MVATEGAFKGGKGDLERYQGMVGGLNPGSSGMAVVFLRCQWYIQA